MLENLERLFVQWLGFAVIAHIPIKRRQIVHACGRLGMLPAKDFLSNLEIFLE